MPRLLFLLSFANLIIGSGAIVIGGIIAPMAGSLGADRADILLVDDASPSTTRPSNQITSAVEEPGAMLCRPHVACHRAIWIRTSR